MVDLLYNPIADMLSLRDAVNQLLESSVVRPRVVSASAFPVNVYQAGDAIKVEALLPGVAPDDVDVTVDQGVLTIAATRPAIGQAAGQAWYLREIYPGQVSRSFALPYPVETERVDATFSNGVLTLTLPIAEVAKPKRIAIAAGHTGQQFPAGQAAQPVGATS